MKRILPLFIIIILFSGFITKPEKAYNIFKKANELLTNNNLENAIKKYEEGLKLNEDKNIYSNLGLAYYRQKKYEEAIDNYDNGSFSDTDYFQLGNSYFNLEKQKQTIDEKIKTLEKALTNYRTAIKNNSDDEHYKYNYELTLKKLNQLKENKNQQEKNKNDKKDDQEKQENNKDNQNKQNEQEDDKQNQENEDKQEKNSSENPNKDNKESKKNDANSGKNEPSENKQGSNTEIDSKQVKLEQAKKILKSLEKKETDDLKNNQRILQFKGNKNTNEMDW